MSILHRVWKQFYENEHEEGWGLSSTGAGLKALQKTKEGSFTQRWGQCHNNGNNLKCNCTSYIIGPGRKLIKQDGDEIEVNTHANYIYVYIKKITLNRYKRLMQRETLKLIFIECAHSYLWNWSWRARAALGRWAAVCWVDAARQRRHVNRPRAGRIGRLVCTQATVSTDWWLLEGCEV